MTTKSHSDTATELRSQVERLLSDPDRKLSAEDRELLERFAAFQRNRCPKCSGPTYLSGPDGPRYCRRCVYAF